jgi:hypothetical protein
MNDCTIKLKKFSKTWMPNSLLHHLDTLRDREQDL